MKRFVLGCVLDPIQAVIRASLDHYLDLVLGQHSAAHEWTLTMAVSPQPATIGAMVGTM